MQTEFEAVIGLEIHAELETRSKMFCSCPVVDSTHDVSNSAVCPVCAGMPGVLPVINRGAVEYALRVALALECEIALTSIFARKSYFYPDLPKGYQISQYERPLARNGRIPIETKEGKQEVRIRRVHLEEDTGKLVHVKRGGEEYSLVDLNRAGIPLLEIVSEPDLHSAEAVRAYALGLRSILRYLGVNSGNLEKGLFRIEPNVSVHEKASEDFGTRAEIKNLNSFRSLERAVAYEIARQTKLLRNGKQVVQQTLGWDVVNQRTVPQRSKEEADDYRYFPEPDLPPLMIEQEWVDEIKAALPELPAAKKARFESEYGLSSYGAGVLVAEKAVADFYEETVLAAPDMAPRAVANWISGELFGLMKLTDRDFASLSLSPQHLGELLQMVSKGEINKTVGKTVLAEMLESERAAEEIVEDRGLRQIFDGGQIAKLVAEVIEENSKQVADYLGGKETIAQWFFGQVMRKAEGRLNPAALKKELNNQLNALKDKEKA